MGQVQNTAGFVGNISATGNICARACDMMGIFVSAASATPTITVYDSASTTTTIPIVTVFTPIAGTYYPIPASAKTGLYLVISGTVNCTVFFS